MAWLPLSLEQATDRRVVDKEITLASGIILRAQQRRRQNRYYRVAIQQQTGQLDRPPSWQWTSTEFSSRETLFQFLRLSGALRLD